MRQPPAHRAVRRTVRLSMAVLAACAAVTVAARPLAGEARHGGPPGQAVGTDGSLRALTGLLRNRALRERARAKIEGLEQEAAALVERERTLLSELRRLEVVASLRTEELAVADAALAEVAAELDASRQHAASLEADAARLRPGIEARLVRLYKLGRLGYSRLIFETDAARSLGRAYRTASMLSTLDRERIDRFRSLLDALADAQRTLETQAADARALRDRAESARAAAGDAVRSRAALRRKIAAERDLKTRFVAELTEAQQVLEETVEQMANGAPPRVVLPLAPFKGDLPRPVEGRPAARFGVQREGRFGTTVLRNGIELEVDGRMPVRAVHEGRVEYAASFQGYGLLVIVDHGGAAFSLYGHLNALEVQAGSPVDRGQLLGWTGETPAGEPRLYFELRVDGRPVDPLEWLEQ